MSEQSPGGRHTGRNIIKARLDSLSLSRAQQKVIGPAEVIGLAGSLIILVLVIVGYLYFLAPARSRLDKLQLERARLQTQLRTSQEVVQRGQTTEATVQNITQSLDVFENNHLLAASRGRMGIYDSLNVLIRKNGLRNTSGPTYTPLDPTGTKTATGGTKSANTKWQSIYPGIAISVTVEGQYQNLRRFIRDVETSKQFVIINSVELERSTETGISSSAEGAEAGAVRTSPVSLRLEMTTYFQRGTEGGAPESAGN